MKALNRFARAVLALTFAAGAAAFLPVTLHAQNSQSNPASAAASRRPITFDDLISLVRISDVQISPDGNWASYSAARPDLKANSSHTNVWLVPIVGGAPRQLTNGDHDGNARWAPDSRGLAFLSPRKGASQIFLLSLDGGEARQLTTLSSGADEIVWSPDGKWLAFTSRVYPDCPDDACNARRDAEKDSSKVKAHIAANLLYRHWTEWWDGKRSHLFVVSASGGAPRDLTPGAAYDVPPFNLGAPEAIAFSPNSREICFTANTDKDEALSTNGDLFVIPADGSGAPRRITTNEGNDWGPVYSPDGRGIAYRSQKTPGYESDRWRLMLYDRQAATHTQLAVDFDRNFETYAWSPDSRTIYFNAEDHAEMPLFAMEPKPDARPRLILADTFNGEFSLSADGKTIAFTRTSLTAPADAFAADSDGTHVRRLTRQNDALLAQLEMNSSEPFWFNGAGETRIEGLLLKPPRFDAAKKYPLLLLVHGGPQGAWDNAWGYRWNPQVMAAPGYVVAMVNPRGSTGYGQKLVSEISGDWGGKVFTDLMNGVDYLAANYPYVNGGDVCAAGGSYGGFMIDWMASQAKGRFKCLISHAGPYDAVAMYGATEELWFEEWEQKGTPWSNPELYQKWSPSAYAADFGKYKTPVLVIGGEKDFRVPYTQDLEFFTALQRQGVPSKLIIFPDEGHWVLKPQNSQLWYSEFLAWLHTYLK